MSSLVLTLAVAFSFIIIAIVLLAIGWLITGRSKIRLGSCGRDPTKKRNDDEGCGVDTYCQLCKKPKDRLK